MGAVVVGVGTEAVGAVVAGLAIVGAIVGGADEIGAGVLGLAMTGAAVIGLSVPVANDGMDEGVSVWGASVEGLAVIGAGVVCAICEGCPVVAEVGAANTNVVKTCQCNRSNVRTALTNDALRSIQTQVQEP